MMKVLKIYLLLFLMFVSSIASGYGNQKTEEVLPWRIIEINMSIKNMYVHNLHPSVKYQGSYPDRSKCEMDNLDRQCRVMIAQGGDIMKNQL